jgi:hypothetical protein
VAGSVPTRHGRRASWDLLQPERITSATVVRRPSAEKMSDSAESKSRSPSPSPSPSPQRSGPKAESRGGKQQSSSRSSRQGEGHYYIVSVCYTALEAHCFAGAVTWRLATKLVKPMESWHNV